jgi:hypothetical protein
MKSAALARNALTSVMLILIPAAALPATAMAEVASEPVIYLNQAWSQDDREWYYHFSQGSAALSYEVFLNLEVADGQDLFRSDANSVRYGLLPEPISPYNPDGLPIGISKTTLTNPVKGWAAGDYAGHAMRANGPTRASIFALKAVLVTDLIYRPIFAPSMLRYWQL